MVTVHALLEGPSDGLGRCLCSRGKHNPPKCIALALTSEDVLLRFPALLDKVACIATELAARGLLLSDSWCQYMALDCLLMCSGLLHARLEGCNRLREHLALCSGGG
jgi:hypothetical protein